MAGRRYEQAKQDGAYHVRSGIIITLDDLLRAVRCNEGAMSGTVPTVDLMEVFTKSTMLRFMPLVHEIIEAGKADNPGRELRLIFLKLRCILGVYTPG